MGPVKNMTNLVDNQGSLDISLRMIKTPHNEYSNNFGSSPFNESSFFSKQKVEIQNQEYQTIDYQNFSSTFQNPRDEEFDERSFKELKRSLSFLTVRENDLMKVTTKTVNEYHQERNPE